MTEQPERKPRQRRRKPTQITQGAADGLAQFIAIPVSVLAPKYALSDVEVKALANALYDAATSNMYIAAIISNLTGVGGVGELLAVGGAIVGKRVAERQLEGQDKPDIRMVGIAATSEIIIQSIAMRSTEDVATGAARATNRKHRQRKDNTSAGDSSPSPVRDNTVDKAGQIAVAGLDDSEDSEADQPRRRRKVHSSPDV